MGVHVLDRIEKAEVDIQKRENKIRALRDARLAREKEEASRSKCELINKMLLRVFTSTCHVISVFYLDRTSWSGSRIMTYQSNNAGSPPK